MLYGYLFDAMCNKHWTGAKTIISFIKLYLAPNLGNCSSKQKANSRFGPIVVVSLPTVLSLWFIVLVESTAFSSRKREVLGNRNNCVGFTSGRAAHQFLWPLWIYQIVPANWHRCNCTGSGVPTRIDTLDLIALECTFLGGYAKIPLKDHYSMIARLSLQMIKILLTNFGCIHSISTVFFLNVTIVAYP